MTSIRQPVLETFVDKNPVVTTRRPDMLTQALMLKFGSETHWPHPPPLAAGAALVADVGVNATAADETSAPTITAPNAAMSGIAARERSFMRPPFQLSR